MKKLLLAVNIFFWLGLASAVGANTLTETKWVPVSVDGAEFAPSPETFIEFGNDGQFFGNAGCNTIRGRFAFNQNAILLGLAATTMMMCPGDVSQQEFTFNRALGRARFFEYDNAQLVLKDGGGIEILRLNGQSPD